MTLAAVFNAWETLPWGAIGTLLVLAAVILFILKPSATTREGALGCLAPFAVAIAALLILVVVASFVSAAARNGGRPPSPSLCPDGTNLAGCPNYVAPHLPGEDPLPESQRQGLNPDGTRPTPEWMARPDGTPAP